MTAPLLHAAATPTYDEASDPFLLDPRVERLNVGAAIATWASSGPETPPHLLLGHTLFPTTVCGHSIAPDAEDSTRWLRRGYLARAVTSIRCRRCLQTQAVRDAATVIVDAVTWLAAGTLTAPFTDRLAADTTMSWLLSWDMTLGRPGRPLAPRRHVPPPTLTVAAPLAASALLAAWEHDLLSVGWLGGWAERLRRFDLDDASREAVEGLVSMWVLADRPAPPPDPDWPGA